MIKFVSKLIGPTDQGMVDIISIANVQFEPSKISSPGILQAAKMQVENMFTTAANIMPIPQNEQFVNQKLKEQSNEILATELESLAKLVRAGVFTSTEITKLPTCLTITLKKD